MTRISYFQCIVPLIVAAVFFGRSFHQILTYVVRGETIDIFWLSVSFATAVAGSLLTIVLAINAHGDYIREKKEG